jgi:hypothetical protein
MRRPQWSASAAAPSSLHTVIHQAVQMLFEFKGWIAGEAVRIGMESLQEALDFNAGLTVGRVKAVA